MKKILEEIKYRFELAKLYRFKARVDHEIMVDGFYGESILDQPLLDKFLYRGKGRPRKTDYSTLPEIQKKINNELNRVLSSNH